MLTELCQELKNWFDRDQPKLYGSFEIIDGKITTTDFTSIIQTNQYFRIVGSVFNDGVYQYTDELNLTDESFSGSIWLMTIPKGVIDLSTQIAEWISQYGDAAYSPYQSESFGGYSYSKFNGGSSSNSSGPSWQSAFASKLNLWRKL